MNKNDFNTNENNNENLQSNVSENNNNSFKEEHQSNILKGDNDFDNNYNRQTNPNENNHFGITEHNYQENAFNQNNQHDFHSFDNEYSNPYSNFLGSQHFGHSTSEKVNYVTKKSLLLALTMCILLSTLLGFGAGYISYNFKSQHSKLSIVSSDETNTDTTKTSDGSTLTVAEVAETTGNSVVEITTETAATENFMNQYTTKGAGSGVIVSNDGYIVTNNHVIEGAKKITVTLKNDNDFEATVVGQDSKEDVALLKINATDLTPVVFGDSSKLKVGQTAIAIGNPLGQLGGTVTDGIISALDRDISMEGITRKLLQTNAAVNPGNSGGGLFDNNGNLIGLVVAKTSGSGVEGLGFAIPANTVKQVIEELSEYGYVKGRVDLQMSLVDVTSPTAALMYHVSQTGVYVSKVESGSNAETAGFRSGDLIKSINSKEVSTTSAINSILSEISAGNTVQVVVQRNGQNVDLNWTLAEKKPTNLS